jgi:RIP metalloprotease RseP
MTVLALFVLLGVLITVHELGHFVVAKLSGVRVLTFSLGFGPKLVRFTRGETEYCLSVLPLGGYVRMYGDDANEEVPAAERRYAFLEKPFAIKSAIALAGPLANLALPLLLFFAVGLGEQQVGEARVGTVLPGEPAATAGLRPGDRVVAVEGDDVADFDALVDAISARPAMATRLVVERPTAGAAPERLELTLTPTPSPSPDPTTKAKVGRIGMLPTRALPFVVVDRTSAAAAAGVRDGDRVVSVDGAAVADRAALLAALAAAPPGAPLTLVLERSADGATGKTQHTIVVPPTTTTTTATTATTSREQPGAPPAEVLDARTDQPADVAPPPAAARPIDVAALRFAVTQDDLEDAALRARIDDTRRLVADAVAAQRAARGIAPLEGLVTSVDEESPAGARGLKAKESRVVAVDGRALRIANDLPLSLLQEPEGVHVVGLVHADGTAATLAFRMPKSPRRELGGMRVLGLGLASAQGEPALLRRTVGAADALRGAVADLGEACRVVLAGYWMLLSGEVGLDQIGGPVLIANLAGDAARAGSTAFIATMCIVSVNLAFLNLLPVPVLDGGHLLLFVIEALRRRRLSTEARMKATKVGLLFVGALMFIALFNDLRSLLP